MIEQRWCGDTVVCIASGPSIDMDDIEYIRDSVCRVIAVNDNYKIAPFSDILYACDSKWWDWHNGAEEFKGERWTMDRGAATKYGLNYVKGIAGCGLSTDSACIHTGSNSGFQAINLAYLLGAARVVLTGYDMKFAGNGASHWFGDHPDLTRSSYDRFIREFERLSSQKLVEVINCTRDTALTCFPKLDLRNVL